MESSFQVLVSTKFIGLADGNIINWCPTLNLLTVSMNKMSIWVYRLNGERIYSINNKSPILSISFLDSGKYFCLSGVDDLIKIYDSDKGDLVKVLDKKFNDITLVKCSCHKVTDGQESLFKVDILNNLPKLHMSNGDQASDTSNGEKQLNLRTLNYLTIVDSTGIYLNINNLITIPHIDFTENKGRYIDSFENGNLFQQWFLAAEDGMLKLMEYKLAEKESAMNKKSIVEILSNACQIISIIDFIKEQLKHIQEEVAPFLQLLDRHLSNLHSSITWKGESQEKKEAILSCFYDLLLTGLVPIDLKDYLLNQLGERGIKKLNKSGNALYDSARRVAFTNVISSLERLMVLLNELKALSRWFEDSENKLSDSMDKDTILKLIDIAKMLLKKLYQMIWDINEEQKLFNKFLAWVKVDLIDKVTKEDDIESYQNASKTIFKNSDILKFFNEYLLQSRMLTYFNIDLSTCDLLQQINCDNDIMSSFRSLENECKDKFIETLKQFMKKNVSYCGNIPLFSENYSKTQCRSLKDEYGLVLISSNAGLSFIKFPYGNPKAKVETIFIFSEREEVIDFQFTNDNELLLLLHKEEFVLESIDLRNIPTTEYELKYEEISKIKIQTIKDLKEPKFLTVNESLGCVLDANRQNYIVFKV